MLLAYPLIEDQEVSTLNGSVEKLTTVLLLIEYPHQLRPDGTGAAPGYRECQIMRRKCMNIY